MLYRLRKNIKGNFKIIQEKGTTKNLFIELSKSELFCSIDKINEVFEFIYNQNLKIYSDRTKRVYETLQGAIKMFNEKYLVDEN